jgi:hypothetical protein
MLSLKDLRTRKKSIEETQKITKAMQMIAASKLRRAQAAAEAAHGRSSRATAPKYLVLVRSAPGFEHGHHGLVDRDLARSENEAYALGLGHPSTRPINSRPDASNRYRAAASAKIKPSVPCSPTTRYHRWAPLHGCPAIR